MADLDVARRRDAERPLADLISQYERTIAVAGALRRTAYQRILPLINYENRQCGLRAAKTIMTAGGVIGSHAIRHPPSNSIRRHGRACSKSRTRLNHLHALGQMKQDAASAAN